MTEEVETKILVVDDEPDILTYFQIVLEDTGHTILSASSADEALEIARAERPDLICLDIMMPKRSGLACYMEIRNDPKLRNVPVIIVSAFNQSKDVNGIRFRDIIANDNIPEPEKFIEKPIQPEHFVGVIESILRGAREVHNA